MARRYDHTKEELRSLIINSARDMIAEGGFESLSSRKIAKRINYTSGTLFYEFGTLADIVLHVNYITLDTLEKKLTRSNTKYGDPVSLSKVIGRTYLDFVNDNPELCRCLFEYKFQNIKAIPEDYTNKINGLFKILEEPLSKIYPNNEHLVTLSARTIFSSVYGICSLAQKEKLDMIGHYSEYEMLDNLLEAFFGIHEKKINLDAY